MLRYDPEFRDTNDAGEPQRHFAQQCPDCRRWLAATCLERDEWDVVGIACTCYESDGITQAVEWIVDIPDSLRAHARAEVRRIAEFRSMSPTAS
ncbi:hypothetical protein [Aurantimonas sp. HBX-1]|uniref:hypothetical protein n=1 Tax=Aurantimonas sp. HBX-1 TaxID=2906072 RepID=UPI001F3429F3|nr:hypothetical protein [Aurantimonas sp. HBX-1]UIJ73476.1 hypothetical protein LXB15_07540 [Aurantimonas sp. HBX-1]